MGIDDERAGLAVLRPITLPFVADPASGVCIRDRLKLLTHQDEQVVRAVGTHLGSLAAADLKTRIADGLGHSSVTWAARKRNLTAVSSSRWAGSITKASHDQWALSRRAQQQHMHGLQAGIDMIRHRLSLPISAPGSRDRPGGYRSGKEWHAKSRRLGVLQDRLTQVQADRAAGRVHVVRGGRRLLNTRHHLDEAGLTGQQWRARWEAARWHLSADGESGKRFGNETIRITPDGQVSIRLPAPLAHLANAPDSRYVVTSRVTFAYRGQEWRERIEANQAVAYRIHLDVDRGRWYIDASWQRQPPPAVPLEVVRAGPVIGVDTNADHLACWRLDKHGNPTGRPRNFNYQLSGPATRRDAQLRHALTRLLRWTQRTGIQAIAIENLDFTDSKTREKHGRRKRFRRLISGIPTGKLRARVLSMCAQSGISIVAVDPAYTSKWGAQHWQKPLTCKNHAATRHEAAAVAIGRRAQGHPIRRRTAPPRHDQSDRVGHRTAQARPGVPGCEGTRRRVPGPRTRSVPPGHRPNAATQDAQDRSGRPAEQQFYRQNSPPLSLLGTVGRARNAARGSLDA